MERDEPEPSVAPSAPVSESQDRFGRGAAVLVVDDDEAIRRLLELQLRSMDFKVETAATLDAARRSVERGVFDLVLLDRKLPDGSGLDLAREIVARRDECQVVMMSAFADVSSAVEAIRLGAADYLLKPMRRHEVVERLRRVVQLRELKRRNQELLDELRQKNRQLESLVVRDPLTGLYNHAFVQERLETEIAAARRNDREFGLLFADLDAFKRVNDTHGHAAGDSVLQGVAAVLKGASGGDFRLRGADVASRYGGDEFVIVLPDTPKMGAAAKAEHLRAAVERHAFPGAPAPQTVSVGVASWPEDGATRDDLIRAADAALYAAKSLGRNRVVTYAAYLAGLGAPEETANAAQLIGLDRSVSNRSFRFLYQPIVRGADHAVFAYEALCRPTDEVFSGPPELIAAAERAGRVWELGRVLREMAAGPAAALPGESLLFINLHPYELNDPELLERPLVPDAGRVVFEVTETQAIGDFARASRTLKKLRERGFRVALDDVGAGYSGLNTLAQLEPDFVKLDAALFRGAERDSRTTRLVKHILTFAAGEGIQVIAEGIETEEERAVAASLGCPLLQGYLFARPAPPFVSVPRRALGPAQPTAAASSKAQDLGNA